MYWSHGRCFSTVWHRCPRKQYWISNTLTCGCFFFLITNVTWNKLFPPLILLSLSCRCSLETYWLNSFNPHHHVRRQPAWHHCRWICFIRLPLGANLHYAKHLFKHSAFVALVSTVPQHSSVAWTNGKEIEWETKNRKPILNIFNVLSPWLPPYILDM